MGIFAWTGRVCGSRNITGRGRGLPTGPLTGKARHPPCKQGEFMVVHIKWCRQRRPGGARDLFFQITSSGLVWVRGRANWRQGRSCGQVLRGTLTLYRFVDRRRGAGGRRTVRRFARIRMEAGGSRLYSDILPCLCTVGGSHRSCVRASSRALGTILRVLCSRTHASRRPSHPWSYCLTWWVPQTMMSWKTHPKCYD